MLDTDAFDADVKVTHGPIARDVYYHLPFYDDLLVCERCPCRQEARRVVPGEGRLDAEFLVLGQNPGEDEDQQARPFIGRGGKELDQWLVALGLDRTKILLTNAVKCHTTKNRVPKQSEINICTQAWLRQELTAFTRLKVLIPLGKPATKVILGKLAVPTLDPFWIKVQFGMGRVLHCCPLPHPAYLLRQPGKRPELFTRVLPQVADYFAREVPEAYERARP